MPELDLSFVDQTVSEIGRGPEAVIPILQSIQVHYRYLPQEALQRVCELSDITPAAITGVSTFYTGFHHQPVGKHLIHVCNGTACHLKGSALIQDAVANHLRLSPGQDTDGEGRFTVRQVACLGCCTLAPLIQIDDATYGHLSPQEIPSAIRDFLERQNGKPQRSRREESVVPSGAGEIRVGLGSCCVAQGSDRVHEALEQVVGSSRIPVAVKQVGCVGMCHQTPLVELVLPGGESTHYCNVKPDNARQIVLDHFRPKGITRRIGLAASRLLDRFHTDEQTSSVVQSEVQARESSICEFLGPQKHIATEFCGQIDPLDLDEYLRHDGFAALRRCVSELEPKQIVDQIRESGLRGRGGAGFPTHIKWETVRKAKPPTPHPNPLPHNVAEPTERSRTAFSGEVAGERGLGTSAKYVICNGDEGDPGAFMDRMLLESYPYRIIEGLAIAALAVGANEAIFYIRAEYPLAVRRIREAVRRCEVEGLLGEGIFSSDFRLHVSVQEGAGAFICGEETALIRSLEGNRGTPRLRPPYPAVSGLWDKPTLVNNVETLAVVPWIVRHGADKYAAMGTEKSKGTKVFALAGKIVRGGLIEVPMGVTIREVVEQIGGGVVGGRQWKAVLVGGPSGGCVPAALADTPVDYEALSEVGAIMGSGGLVVLDDTDCIVDVARYFLRFTQDQSCGKCTFCRVGTKRMLEILDRICTGKGRRNDLKLLEDLSSQVASGSICGLGKTAPNPVLSTLKFFRDEYEAHLDGRCPAGKCKDLIEYQVKQNCIGCTICAQLCPADAIAMAPYRRHQIETDACTCCDICRKACPEDAIEVVTGVSKTPLPVVGRRASVEKVSVQA